MTIPCIWPEVGTDSNRLRTFWCKDDYFFPFHHFVCLYICHDFKHIHTYFTREKVGPKGYNNNIVNGQEQTTPNIYIFACSLMLVPFQMQYVRFDLKTNFKGSDSVKVVLPDFSKWDYTKKKGLYVQESKL